MDTRVRKSPFPMVSVDDALSLILLNSTTLSSEVVPLSNAFGRVLAQNVLSRENFPPFAASIMDGYAVIAEDGPGVFPVVGRITAGMDPDFILQRGQVAYITTGAKLPQGANAVVKVEDTKGVNKEDSEVQIEKGVKVGEFIRTVGCDVAIGQQVLSAGQTLSSVDIGLLATLGITNVEVVVKAKVGILSTGDELVEPEETVVEDGKIRDSNRLTLSAEILEYGALPYDLGIVRDNYDEIQNAISKALDDVDILITSGGVSMGEADLIKPILEGLGTVHFGRLNMKPGKPTTFATVERNNRKKLIFALPGNPVSCVVTSKLLIQPAIKRLYGLPFDQCVHSQVDGIILSDIKLDPERYEYHRAIVQWDFERKQFVAQSTGIQQSSRLMSLKNANGLLCLPQKDGILRAGSIVSILLIGPILPPVPMKCYHKKTSTLGFSDQELKEVEIESANFFKLKPSTLVVSGGCHHHHAHQNHEQQQKEEHKHHHDQCQDHDHCRNHAHHHGESEKLMTIKTALLTISDRASSGEYEDKSGPAMVEFLTQTPSLKFQSEIFATAVIPDDIEKIQQKVLEWCDDDKVNVIFTSGGTGFGPRDLTPEAIQPLIHRNAPGVATKILQDALHFTPFAVMSRPVCGVRNKTFILTLPGSPKAVKENLQSIAPLLPHIVNLING